MIRCTRLAFGLATALLGLCVGRAAVAQELFVSSSFTNQVKRYDATTGSFVDNFVAAGSGGLSGPDAAAFGPGTATFISAAPAPTR